MEVTSVERAFLEQNIEEELSDYKKYMEQAQQATHPQLARLWHMFAQDERRHAERQRAVLELALQMAPAPAAVTPAPAVAPSPAAVVPVPPPAAVRAPAPGFQWRGAPWPGIAPRPALYQRSGCCGGDPR